MKMSGNTILITGGTSGIGLELATQFLELGNVIIITGRNQAKLDVVRAKFPKIHTILSDASDPAAIAILHERILREFPALNILINNAGIMRKINLHKETGDLADMTREIEINLMGPICMIKQFLPHLKLKDAAAIINISSGLAFVPLPISPIYSATKSGLHSFTQSLRFQLKNTHIKVFELAAPGTNTPLFKNDFTKEDIMDLKPISVEKLVKFTMMELAKDNYEIRPGLSNFVKWMSRIAPQYIADLLAKPVDRMLSQMEK